MDNTTQNDQAAANNPPLEPKQGLEKFTEEMYGKNFELQEKNETLSLLRKIDEIILSKVTDVNTIAQQVVNIVAQEAEFKAVAIYLTDRTNNTLHCIAISETELVKKITSVINKPFYSPTINLVETRNHIASCVREKIVQISHDEIDILQPYFTEEETKKIKEIDEIKSSLIYPLIVRDIAIGAMIINLGESEESLFQYQQALVDRLSGVVGIAIDNAMLYQNIQDANERLKSLDKLKDEFVSLASHELRTPMTAIKSYLWLVLQETPDLGKLTEKQKLYLDRSYQSTERLIRLVNDMLNVSRIESGRITLNLKSISIVTVVNDVIEDILPAAENRHLSLSAILPAGDLPNVIADPEKIKEVVVNLIGNSLKFTPEGGKITVSFEQKDGMIFTNITDTGKGIKAEDMPKLFQKFGMVEGNYLSMATSQGSGLGLYITKNIVELHGGKITVSSEGENKGTTFTFSLKIAN